MAFKKAGGGHETAEWNAYEIQARKTIYQLDQVDEAAILAKSTHKTRHVRRWASELSQVFNSTHPLFSEEKDVIAFQKEIDWIIRILARHNATPGIVSRLNRLNFELIRQLQSKQYLYLFGSKPDKKSLLRSYLHSASTKTEEKEAEQSE